MAHENGETEAFIIGGGQIYAQSMDLCDKLYLTEVDLTVDGDIFFPALDMNQWELISEEKHNKDDKNDFDYTFKVLKRIRYD
jgi:dihydrofolate reductase